MKQLFANLLVFLFLNTYPVVCQNRSFVDKWEEYIQEMGVDVEDEGKLESLYSELSYISEHPFDLNNATARQLNQLPFLSDKQIENIIAYQTKYGEMVTIYELKNVEGLDPQTISLLLPFIHIGNKAVDKRLISVDNLFKYGTHELQITYNRGLQQKKGYESFSDSILDKYPNRKYVGEPFYHSLRYAYNYTDKIQVGFVGEKDAGEAFWNGYHKGYDFYSAHLFLKEIKRLKSLAIGDYKVSFGQGLIVSNDFSLSKSVFVTQAQKRTNGFRRHYSTNETDYFRGVATTINMNTIDLSFFYSNRNLDGSVDSKAITSIKTDGLHRIIREIDKKNTIAMQSYGANIRYATPNLCVGLTGLYYSFGSNELQPEPKPYTVYSFRGNNNINMGVDYLLKNKNIQFYGETAVSKNGALAMLNALHLMPTSYISFLLSHRYYDKEYHSFYGNAFSQNSVVQNEQGVYWGMQLTPFAHWKVSGYADTFYFPWLKYGVDAPSSGKEYMAQVDYTKNENVSFYIRYKYMQKEKNIQLSEQPTTSILPYRNERLRVQIQYKWMSVYFKTAIEGKLYQEEKASRSEGYLFSQNISWRPRNKLSQIDVSMAYFNTDDYDSRLSSYEKNLLYSFNTSSFYGEGIRLSTVFRWNIMERVSISAKVAFTHYIDRESIGSDLEMIAGRNKTDIYTLMRWKF